MIDILITLWSELTNSGVGPLIIISVLLVCLAVYLGAKEYGKNYFKHLLHKRNLYWLLGWLVAVAVFLLYFQFEIMSRCPAWLGFLLLILFGLFTVAVFRSVSGPVFLTRWYLKRHEKWLREGKTYEHRQFVDKRPWFILDHDERIHYEVMRARYLKNLGDAQGSYNAACAAEDMSMYPEERVDLDISRVFMLAEMGDIPKARLVLNSFEKKDRPAYCFLHSFILELEGKLDEAFNMAVEAENAMEPGYHHLRVKTALYNHLGRMYCYRNNETELFRYFSMAAEEAKKMGDMSQIHLVYHNLIDQHLINNRPRATVQAVVDEYTKLIKMDHADGICQIINLRLRLARHYADHKAEHDTILWGYQTLKKVSNRQSMAGHEVTMLMMLRNGGFPLDPIFCDVEESFNYYFTLPMPMRFVVIWNLAHLNGLTKEQYDRTYHWRDQIKEYLENQAISDLEEFEQQVPTACVNQRCWILISKVDVSAFLARDNEKQLRWLKELQQIYVDHGLLLKQAQNDAHIAKYYAQQLECGTTPPKTAQNEIRVLMDRALEKSEQLPWPLLGNLLVEIACGYAFIKDWERVQLVLNRFHDLGLTEQHCGYDQKIELNFLKRELLYTKSNV